MQTISEVQDLTQPRVKEINWAQIWSLAGLNAAVVISWIAYHNYLPAVVGKFKFYDLAYFITVTQAIILVIIPPVAGLIGDYMIKKSGKRFIVFTVGTGVTAMVFMAVAGLVNLDPLSSMKWVLPIMIIIWLISMNIFHSPANSMLDLFAPTSGLPIVMAIITMTSEVLYGLEPIVVIIVNFLGPTLTFVTGGVLLIVTGTLFLKTTKSLDTGTNHESATEERSNNYFAILAVGITFGLVTAFIFKFFPEILSVKLKEYDSQVFGGNHFSAVILIMAALLAIPASKLVEQLGLAQALMFGIVASSITIIIIVFSDNQSMVMFACVVLAFAYSIVSVSAFPFTLRSLSPKNLTFGAGLFFGSLELATGVFDVLLFGK